MHRRALLATLGTSAVGASTLGLAGCVDYVRPGESTTTPPSGPTGSDPTATGSTGAAKPVTFDALQPAVVELQTDRLSVPSSSSQHLFLDVGGSSEHRPPRDAFSLRFDGREFTPATPGNPPLYRERTDSPYSSSTGTGWLLFVLPESGDADGTRLLVDSSSSAVGDGASTEADDVAWRPSPAVRERLAAPSPDLRVSPSFPDAVEEFAEPTVTVTVENRGPVPTRFVAGLSRSGPSVAMAPIARVSERIDAGATREVGVTDDFGIGAVDDVDVGDGTGDMQYFLEWAGGSAEAAVEVVAPG